jgi:vancomycin permeability regulator SanA
VLHKLYCIIKDRILLLFYVDNIIVAYYKNKLNAATRVVNMLKEKYTITRGDNLQ